MRRLKLKLGSYLATPGTLEHTLLFLSVIAIYWTYAGLGRDIFYNKLYDPTLFDPIGSALNYIRLVICAAAVLVVIHFTTINWALTRIPQQFLPFALFALASSFWGDAFMPVFQSAVSTIALWVGISVVVHRLGAVDSARAALYLVTLVCIASFLLAIFLPSIGRHTGTEVVQAVHVGRWRGIFSHKNALGPWAAYGSVFLFTHAHMLRASRPFLWLGRISAVSCLIFAGSATSVVLAGSLFGIWFFLRLLRFFSRTTVTFLLVMVAVLSGLILTFASEFVFDLLGRDSSLTGRTRVWELAWKFFLERPLAGVGYQALGGVDYQNTLEILMEQAIPGAESGYLTLLLDLGLIGVILFFVPYLASIRNGLQWLPYVSSDDRASLEFMLMTLISFLVYGITETAAFVATGFDGVIGFGALFFMSTLPRSPASILKREARKARHWRRVAQLRRGGGSSHDVFTKPTHTIES